MVYRFLTLYHYNYKNLQIYEYAIAAISKNTLVYTDNFWLLVLIS